MNRYTKRGANGRVYGTGPATVCWGGRPAGERVFCVGCHGAKDNSGVDRSKCGPLAIIDRLAAYEDTGLEPEEVSEYQRLCDSYAKAGLDAKFVQFCIDATQNGLSMDRIRKLSQAEKDGRLVVLPPNDPLTLEELRKMDGEPVWVTHRDGSGGRWGIVNIYPTGICADVCSGQAYWFEDYIGTIAYRHKPEGDIVRSADVCAATGGPCCKCKPGPCDSRKPGGD